MSTNYRIKNSRLIHHILFLGIGYFLLAELGKLISFSDLPFATFWPAAGLYCGVLAKFRIRYWSALIPSAVSANLISDVLVHETPLSVSLGFCLANTSSAIIGAVLLRSLNHHHGKAYGLQKLKRYIYLALTAPISGSIIGTSIVEYSFGTESFVQTACAWWIADCIGVLIVAPIVYGFHRPTELKPCKQYVLNLLEFSLIIAAIICTTAFSASQSDILTMTALFGVFPLLVCSGARFGLPGASFSLLMLFSMMAFYTSHGLGPFSIGEYSDVTRMIVLQMFTSLAGISFLAVAAITEDWSTLVKLANEAKEEADKSNQIKGQFLANMSHEIRTPMSAIIGFTDIVLESEIDQDQQSHLQQVQISANHLLELINDILDLTKVESGQMELLESQFKIEVAVKEVVASQRIHAEKHSTTIECHIHPEVPPEIIADQKRLRQILTNLVGNAVKFTNAGTVSVNVKCIQDQGKSFLQFSVTDTGIGIQEEFHPHLFKPFEQANTTNTRDYGGTGLGLAICKDIVELMQGTIWFESQPGWGTRFHFTIPLNVPTTSEQSGSQHIESRNIETRRAVDFASETTLVPGGSPFQVLVVEDNPVNQKLISEILSKHNIEVYLAANGAIGIELWESSEFDCVLMDMQMPVMDGITATKEIRKREKLRRFKTPIIALTANAMVKDKKRCLQAGMDGFLSKPFKVEDLLLQMMQSQKWIRTVEEAKQKLASGEEIDCYPEVLSTH